MIEQVKNLNQAILGAMDIHAGRTCFLVKRGSRYQDISYGRFKTLTLQMVHFFRRQGLSTGDRVAIVADNSLEWMVTYIACLFAGGVAVPLRTSLTPAMLHFILQDTGAGLAILQEQEFATVTLFDVVVYIKFNLTSMLEIVKPEVKGTGGNIGKCQPPRRKQFPALCCHPFLVFSRELKLINVQGNLLLA